MKTLATMAKRAKRVESRKALINSIYRYTYSKINNTDEFPEYIRKCALCLITLFGCLNCPMHNQWPTPFKGRTATNCVEPHSIWMDWSLSVDDDFKASACDILIDSFHKRLQELYRR